MLRKTSGVLVAAVVTLLALSAVTGSHRFQGPVVVVMTPEHGLHAGDLLVVLAWAVSLVLLAVLVAEPTRSGR